MRNFIVIFFLLTSLVVSAQIRTGLVHPRVLGQPSDTTKFGVVLLDTITKAGNWYTLNPTDFEVNGSELSLKYSTDSVFVMGDSLCAITNGDTLCVFQDSVFITSDSFCIIQMGDTTCVVYSGGLGENIYTSDGTFTSNRTGELDGSWLKFTDSGTPLFYINPSTISAGSLLTLSNGYTFGYKSMLGLTNLLSGADSDAFMTYTAQGGTNYQYSTGVDRSSAAWALSEGSQLGIDHAMLYYGGGDSLVFKKDIQVDAGLLDNNGSTGTSGQVLTSTGIGIDWLSTLAIDVPISSLIGALGNNSFNNANYQQEWQWNTLAGGSGLKLSSTSTAAIGSTQKLFEVALSGANATASQSTYAGYFSNTHTGTGALSYGLYGNGNTYGLYGNGVTVGTVGTTTSGTGVYGSSSHASSGIGVSGSSAGSLGIGVFAQSTNGGDAFFTDCTAANTASAFRNSLFSNSSTGTPAAGFGGYNDYYLETTTAGVGYLAARFYWQWSDATFATRTSRMIYQGVNSGTTNTILTLEGNKSVIFAGRSQDRQGADVASAAGAIALGYDGNSFEITGTNAITLISNLGWQNGSEITLIFTSTATLTDGTANSGTDIGMELAGNSSFSASADDLITLHLCEIGGTQRWREKSRSAN